MKQFFQVFRGILLCFVLLETLIFLGTKLPWLHDLVGQHSLMLAALLLFLCLYRTFIRKGYHATADDKAEYLVTMEKDAYGRIGNRFAKEQYGEIERLPGGFLTGIRTYRLEDGRLIFTVNRMQWGKLLVRPLVTAVILFALLVPCSAVSYVDALNVPVGRFLSAVGLVPHASSMAYLDVPPVSLPWGSEEAAADAELHHTEPEPEPQPEPQPEPEETEEPSGGVLEKVKGWFTGVTDWAVSLFDRGTYLLPSDRREIIFMDIKDMDSAQIQRCINEMYARHGYDLSSSQDADYFSKQKWYHPDPALSAEEVRAQFSDIEQTNLDFLIERRAQLYQQENPIRHPRHSPTFQPTFS